MDGLPADAFVTEKGKGNGRGVKRQAWEWRDDNPVLDLLRRKQLGDRSYDAGDLPDAKEEAELRYWMPRFAQRRGREGEAAVPVAMSPHPSQCFLWHILGEH